MRLRVSQETVTKEYLPFLSSPRSQDHPDNEIFNQDGPPPRFANPVGNYLDEKLPNV